MAIIYNPHKKKGFFRIPSGGTKAVSCAFSYSASSYTTSDPDPTPTITGDSGGVFTSTAGIVINSATGEITLASSSVASYVITYTVKGKACQQTIDIASGFDNDYCLDFDGTNDYITLGGDATLSGPTTTTFSVSVWIKLDQPSGAGSYNFGDHDCVLGRGDNTWGANKGWLLKVGMYSPYTVPDDFMLKFTPLTWDGGIGGYGEVTIPIDVTNTNANEIHTDTWHQIVCTYSPSAGSPLRKKIYLDGVLIDTNETGTVGIDFSESTGKPTNFTVGVGELINGVTTSDFYPGKLDEIAYWSTELTAAHVLEVFGDAGGSGGRGNGETVDLSDLSTTPTPHAWIRMGDNAPAYATGDPQWLLIENSNTV